MTNSLTDFIIRLRIKIPGINNASAYAEVVMLMALIIEFLNGFFLVGGMLFLLSLI